MTDKNENEKEEELEPLPRLLKRQSVAPPPPSHKSRLGEFRIAPSLAKYPVPKD